MTDSEIIAIWYYTGNAFAEINAALRGITNASQATTALASNVLSGLQKLPGVTGKLLRVESRSVPDVLSSFKQGTEVVFDGLTSCSRSPIPTIQGNVGFAIKAIGKNAKIILKIAKSGRLESEVIFLPKNSV